MKGKSAVTEQGYHLSPKLACVNAVCVLTYCGMKGSSDEHRLGSLEENNNDDDDDDPVHAVLLFPLQQTRSAFAACRPKRMTVTFYSAVLNIHHGGVLTARG